jgi:hypothetical protein
MKVDIYYMIVFLNVLQIFNKVWYNGLLYKIKNSFLFDLYVVIKSYLLYRTFIVKYREVITQLKEMNSVISQNVLGLELYIADLPIALGITTAIYADDTATLVTHNNTIEAFLRLQKYLS